MISMDELKNKVVMVHPTLTYDPVNMQGFMGSIARVDIDKDEVLVRFKNQMLGLYSADALLMLIPGMEVLDKLRAETEDLDEYDLIDVLQIYLLDATPDKKRQREALELATRRANLMFATVISVQDYIDLKRGLDEYTELSRGR
jgi:hypothetical protein